MSTTFHSDIAVGAAGNASTFNTPLDTLDAALSAVLDPDATLKAGAVDTTAVLANGIVTDAKLATDAKIGSLAALTTTAKTSVQAAINEINGKIAGGAPVTAAQLIAWTEGGAYEMTSVVYSSSYPTVIASATIKWPDASAGTFTTTTINATYSAIDAYTITHTASGKTVTQAAITRNTSGAVVTKPALTVTP